MRTSALSARLSEVLLWLLWPVLALALACISGTALTGPKPVSGQFLPASPYVGAPAAQNLLLHREIWQSTIPPPLGPTVPQNTASYNGSQSSASASVSIPIFGATTGSGAFSTSNQTIKDNYASTEAVESGLYAGNGGLDVNVAGNTTLTAGTLSSTAAAELNSFTTGTLTVNSEQNHSDATATSEGFSFSGNANLGSVASGGAGGVAAIGQSLLGNGLAAGTGGLSGSGVDQTSRSTSASVITAGITPVVTSGQPVQGTYETSTAGSNPTLTNSFNAQTLTNDLAIQQIAGQLTAEGPGDVADGAAAAGPGQPVSGFITASPGADNAFTNAGIFNNAGIMEYINPELLNASGYVPIK